MGATVSASPRAVRFRVSSSRRSADTSSFLKGSASAWMYCGSFMMVQQQGCHQLENLELGLSRCAWMRLGHFSRG